jgi:nucleoid-associated protein YgaU
MPHLEKSLKKAKIIVIDKDALKESALTEEFYVQFNPTEFTRQKGAQIAEIGIYGIDSPILQFIRGQNEKLTLELFFDTTEHGMDDNAVSVTTLTNKFYQLVKIQPHTHAPPRIQFLWGERGGGNYDLKFEAIVESVQERFTLFNPVGIPLRATLSLSLREYKSLERQLSDLKLSSADYSKRHVVKDRENFSTIAGREYGDSGLWRVIADANPGQPNPRNLTPGTVLIIPPLDAHTQSIG